MIRVHVGRNPYDIRLFLESEGPVAPGVIGRVEKEIPIGDLFLSGLTFTIDSESKRKLVLETQRFTLDGVVTSDDVEVVRLEHELRGDIDKPSVEE